FFLAQYPFLPCVRIGSMSKHNYIPMEVCQASAERQKVRKMDERQTADMIKITCQKPHIRQGAIHQQFQNVNGELR
ncbi:unnamed protein product, partial [Discosporangium mesarthrocarpum]